MTRRTAIAFACILITTLSACAKGKIGIIIEARNTVDTAALTRLHVKISDGR